MLKFLLNDDESLHAYLESAYPTFNDIKRSIFLIARKFDFVQTDSHFHLAKQLAFADIKSISEIFTKGVVELAVTNLSIDKKRVHVKTDMQNRFQELITYIPPLLLQSALIHKNHEVKKSELKTYFEKLILPNTRYTAIPSSNIGKLNDLVNDKKGLHDLHIHLNGSLETDQVWQDYLYSPEAVHKDLAEAFNDEEKVREQFGQETISMNPRKYFNLLKIAQRLRFYFFDQVFPTKEKNPTISPEALLEEILGVREGASSSYRHPFITLISEDVNYPHLLAVEALMDILILDILQKKGNETLASMFHFYLLILGLTNRLLVQQVHQYGFEQFQKLTLNKMRDNSETIFLRRYFQLHGNDARFLNFLEGRFSPKDDAKKMTDFVNSIYKGWEIMHETLLQSPQGDPPSFPEPRLKLIAHFIKKSDKKPDEFIRHKKLRWDLANRSEVLYLLLKNHKSFQKKIVGIDAASSEFDAPPEVFAPAFRKIKRELVPRRTFHAGEDFYHLVGGLRAIYEAIVFCDLKEYDRIGHATATGISCDQWSNLIGPTMLISRGDYLDDLIFAYHRIAQANIDISETKINKLISEIERYAELIYENYYTVNDCESSWLMRHICPRHAQKNDRSQAESESGFVADEWDHIIDSGIDKGSKGFHLFLRYHDRTFRKKYDNIIEIKTEDIFDKTDLHTLQLDLLKFMTDKNIVIETLPTSNVRIGIHKNFETYHLWNWIKWKDQGEKIPLIILGTDDTGIFATNIYNEYANIFCMLTQSKSLSEGQAMEIIENIDLQGYNFKFDTT